jgi:hypothetical protein
VATEAASGKKLATENEKLLQQFQKAAAAVETTRNEVRASRVPRDRLLGRKNLGTR